MTPLQFSKSALLWISAVALTSSCSSKTARNALDTPSAPNADQTIVHEIAPEITDPDPQDPYTIPGNYIPYSGKELSDRGGVVKITKRSASQTAKFNGEIFDPKVKPGARVTVLRKIVFPNHRVVESTENVTVQAVDIEAATMSIDSKIQTKNHLYTNQSINKCVRSHDRSTGYYMTCGVPELRDYPNLALSNEAVLESLHKARAICRFTPDSASPLTTTEFGTYVIGPAMIAEESVKETRVYQGKIECREHRKIKKSSGTRTIVTITSYSLPNLFQPMVGQGVTVYSNEVIETPTRTVYSNLQQIIEYQED